MSDNKIFLDLDAIVPEKDVFIVLDKQEHRLAPLTVEQFVINMRNMEKLGKGNLDVETEQGMIVNMLEQVFPTVPKSRFNQMTMVQLNTLIEFARTEGGETKVQQEATTEQANPPVAG